LIRHLAAEGRIVIYSSHILEVVEKIASRVIILHKGRIQADDSVDNLRHLMKVPSLEEIFSHLVLQEEPEKAASELLSLMKKNA